jgi:hypothetical protein
VENLIDKNLTGRVPVWEALEFVFFLLPPDAGPAVSGGQGIHQPGDFCLAKFSIGTVLQTHFHTSHKPTQEVRIILRRGKVKFFLAPGFLMECFMGPSIHQMF